MTTFSIVTVCRNDADALVPTIRSVVNQTHGDLQYVVQDGGSTDATEALVKGFGDWVDVYASAPDSGIYQAMNRAVAHCTGAYTLFINAADYLVSRTTLAELSGQMQMDDDVVTGQAIEAETGKQHPFRAPNMYWAGMTFDHQAAVVRTDLLRENPFDESLRISGDFEFFSRLRLQGRTFRSIPLPICRKPYATGASASFIARFRERFGIAMTHFGDRHPVAFTLTGELIRFMVSEYGIRHRMDELEAMSVDELVRLSDELAAITEGRDHRRRQA